jgi:RNA polymerase sigma-70 factor (ECF subfamily)
MTQQELHDLFTDLVDRHQSELYGYIYAIVRNWTDADDLYQTVCLVLWSKFESFRPDSNFFAWARQTAKITVTNFLSHKRLPTYLSTDLLDELANSIVRTHKDEKEVYLAALASCRAKLGPADQELLQLHYVDELGTREIAERLGRSQSSVCNSLNRIRNSLLECIQKELARQDHARSAPTQAGQHPVPPPRGPQPGASQP